MLRYSERWTAACRGLTSCVGKMPVNLARKSKKGGTARPEEDHNDKEISEAEGAPFDTPKCNS